MKKPIRMYKDNFFGDGGDGPLFLGERWWVIYQTIKYKIYTFLGWEF